MEQLYELHELKKVSVNEEYLDVQQIATKMNIMRNTLGKTKPASHKVAYYVEKYIERHKPFYTTLYKMKGCRVTRVYPESIYRPAIEEYLQESNKKAVKNAVEALKGLSKEDVEAIVSQRLLSDEDK